MCEKGNRMKKTIILSIFSALLFCFCAKADSLAIPRTHWAYEALNKLSSNEVLSSKICDFTGNREISRYEVAITLADMLTKSELAGNKISKEDYNLLKRLTEEFENELSSVGIRANNLETELDNVKEDISSLKKDISNLNTDSEGKYNISGVAKFQVLDINYKYDPELNYHKSVMNLILRSDIKIDNNVSAYTSWGTLFWSEMDGKDKITGPIYQSYVNIDNFLNGNGSLKVGRSMINHGIGIIAYDSYDAVRYLQRKNNINTEYNLIFTRQANDVDYNPTYNFFIEKINKRNKLHLDLYYTNYADGEYEVAYFAGVPKRKVKNCDVFIGNIGIQGSLDHDSVWEYALEGVITKYRDDNNEEPHQTGYATHASMRYTPKKSDWAALLTFNSLTHDCYEEIGTRTRINPWENNLDISYSDIYWDYGTQLVFPNTLSYRFLLKYQPQKHPDHALYLSYDCFKEIDINKPFSHTDKKLDIDNYREEIYNIEYRYNVSEDTTFIINYNVDWDGTKKTKYNDNKQLIFSVVTYF